MRWARTVFAIDLRSLALFRIALGLTLLADLAFRSVDLEAFYTEDGALPTALAEQLTSLVRLSLHAFASPWPALVWLLFGVQFVAALALLLGYRARLASIVCWLLLVSVQSRNPLLSYSGGDQLLRLLLFWSMFLPLDARFALARGNAGRGPGQVLTVSSAALLLQIALIYGSNGLNKLSREPWRQGEALAHALGVTYFSGPLGPWLATQHWLMAPGSWGTIAFELLAPCLAFVPWRSDRLRLAVVALFVGFHVLLMAAFSIGSFPAVCIVAWLVFLPASFWDALAHHARGSLAPAPALDAPRPPRALEALCGAFLLYVFAQVAAGHLRIALPAPLAAAGAALRINQHWGQFERVTPLDLWPVLHGTTSAGAAVDPLLGGAPVQGRPARAADLFPGFRWRIYFWGLLERAVDQPQPPVLAPLVERVAHALCGRWNERHTGGEALVQLRIRFFAQIFDPVSAPHEVYDLEHACEAGR